MKPISKAVGVALVVLAVAVVCAGVYLGVWWLRRDVTDRNARVLQQTYGRQNALVEQILDDIKDANTPGIPPGQRIAIVDQICDAAAKLTESIQLSPSAQQFILKECPQ